MKKQQKELSIPCPKCESKIGRRCINTKTGAVKSDIHNARVAAAKKKSKKAKATCSDEHRKIGQMLEDKIAQILGQNHSAKFIPEVSVGPVITTYKFLPDKRTRVTQIEALAQDFAVLLSAESVYVKRLPGEAAVGIFVPNKSRKIINFRETIAHVMKYMEKKTEDGHLPIPLNFGQDAEGNPFVDDLTMQPHLLVAGTTGGGKSTLLHGVLSAIAWALPSDKLKMLLSDTKTVEFPQFANLPHLQAPIAQSVFQTMEQMKWLTEEAQLRMTHIAKMGVRNIHEYNKIAPKTMPFIILVIDELADLMGEGVDSAIAEAASGYLQTIVQRARTSGIYVIAATQRPGVKTVAGAIKANFPSRLTFRLPSSTDSRTVINTKGAEHLMSRGDMLYSSSMAPELKRLHAPYSSIQDVKDCVQYVIHRENTQNLQNSGFSGATPAGHTQSTRIQ